MPQITSPVPQNNVDVASQETAASNLLTEIKSLLNGSLATDNLSLAARNLLAPPRVTTLPASPSDGDTVDFVADASAGVVWRLRYRAASGSAFKWEALSGAPRVSQGNQTPIGFGFYGWPGAYTQPGFLVPVGGDYDIRVSARIESGLGSASRGYLSFYTTAKPADDAYAFTGTAMSGITVSGNRTTRVTLAAGENVFLQARSSSQVDIYEPQIWLTPVRLG